MRGTPGKSFSQLALEGIFPPSFLLDKKETFIGNRSLVAEKKNNKKIQKHFWTKPTAFL